MQACAGKSSAAGCTRCCRCSQLQSVGAVTPWSHHDIYFSVNTHTAASPQHAYAPTTCSFIANFWEGFKEVLGPRHVIKSLDKCDFTPIYEWHMAEREKKKNTTKEVSHGPQLTQHQSPISQPALQLTQQ